MLQNKKVILLILLFTACTSRDEAIKNLRFSRLIYDHGHINGPGMAFRVEIDSDRTILVERENWLIKKDETDSATSGRFKGRLNPKTYDTLMNELLRSNYLNRKWPDDFCCDGSVETLIIYAYGQRTFRSSMYPPFSAVDLLRFLDQLGLEKTIPRTIESFQIENAYH